MITDSGTHSDIDALYANLPALRVPDVATAALQELLVYLIRRWWLRVKPWSKWRTVAREGSLLFQEHRDGRRRMLFDGELHTGCSLDDERGHKLFERVCAEHHDRCRRAQETAS